MLLRVRGVLRPATAQALLFSPPVSSAKAIDSLPGSRHLECLS